jgi:hypothetical protein
VKPWGWIVLALLMTGLFSTTASAQMSKYVMGISGGASYGDLGLQTTSTDWRWGGTAGVFGAFRASGNTIVTLEGNWVQKGGSGEGDADVKLDYFEIPLMFGGVANLGNSSWRGRLYVGFSGGFQVGCSSNVPLLNCDRTNTVEFGFPFGLVFANTSPEGRIAGIDARYTVGLSDTFQDVRSKTRTFTFKLLFGFPKN